MPDQYVVFQTDPNVVHDYSAISSHNHCALRINSGEQVVARFATPKAFEAAGKVRCSNCMNFGGYNNFALLFNQGVVETKKEVDKANNAIRRDLARQLQETKKIVDDQARTSSIQSFAQMVVGLLCCLVPILGIVKTSQAEFDGAVYIFIAKSLTLIPSFCLGLLVILGRDVIQTVASTERHARILRTRLPRFTHECTVKLVTHTQWAGNLFMGAYMLGFIGLIMLSDIQTRWVIIFFGPILGVILTLLVRDLLTSVRELAFDQFVQGPGT